MSSDAPESAQHAVSEFLHSSILFVCEQMMACETEWRPLDRNLVEAVLSDCACFTVASCVRRRVLRCLFSTLCGVLTSVLLRGTTEYVLMVFKVYHQPFTRTLVHLLSQKSQDWHTRWMWALARISLVEGEDSFQSDMVARWGQVGGSGLRGSGTV